MKLVIEQFFMESRLSVGKTWMLVLTEMGLSSL
jgi:hypothetical protein